MKTFPHIRFEKKILALACCVSLLGTGLSGCSTANPYTGECQASDATMGAGIGAVGGALAGAIIGGQKGALIGGALGGVTGGLIGNRLDQQNAELHRLLVGTGVQVNKIGNSIQLVMASDVTFATNQAAIESNFYPTLNSVAIVLKKYDSTSINISGYTDNSGSAEYNQRLSEQRAESVGSYLASRGISPNRIFTKGLGKRNPVASNATPQGRSMNRRVVITLRPLS